MQIRTLGTRSTTARAGLTIVSFWENSDPTVMAQRSAVCDLSARDVVLLCLALAWFGPLNSPQDAKRPDWRPEINETRFASFPPYLSFTVFFYIFTWAGMVGHPRAGAGGRLDECRSSRRCSERELGELRDHSL